MTQASWATSHGREVGEGVARVELETLQVAAGGLDLGGAEPTGGVLEDRGELPAGLEHGGLHLEQAVQIVAQPHRAKEWTIAAFATLLVGVLLSLATRGGIGMGDAKLGFLMGAGLGWSIVGALVWASLGIFVAAIVVLARGGLGARKDTLPFGPFLALGAVLALFLS